MTLDPGLLFHTVLVVPMQVGLRSLAAVTGSGGVAIIAFTLAMRLILLPLGLLQARSSRSMAALVPEMAALKERHRGDGARLAEEQARLYRERGVQPLAGCLPMLLQMPVMYGMYFALRELSESGVGAEHFGEPFLWLPSLAQPDALSIGALHLPGFLTLLMAAAQWATATLAPPLAADPQQQAVGRATAALMPLMMLLFSLSVPAGLVLYWLASSMISAGQQRLIAGLGGPGSRWPWHRAAPGSPAAADASAATAGPAAIEPR